MVGVKYYKSKGVGYIPTEASGGRGRVGEGVGYIPSQNIQGSPEKKNHRKGKGGGGKGFFFWATPYKSMLLILLTNCITPGIPKISLAMC